MTTIAYAIILAVIAIMAAVRAARLKPTDETALKESFLIILVGSAITFSIFKIDISFEEVPYILLPILNFYVYYYGIGLFWKSLNEWLLRNTVVISSSYEAVNMLIERGENVIGEEVELVYFEGVYYWIIDNEFVVSLSGYNPPTSFMSEGVEVEIVDINEVIQVSKLSFKVRQKENAHICLEEIIEDNEEYYF